MKRHLCFLFAYLSVCSIGVSPVFADTLILNSGATISGTVIQTNGDDLLLLMNYAAFNFSRANIKEIRNGPVETAESTSPERAKDLLPSPPGATIRT